MAGAASVKGEPRNNICEIVDALVSKCDTWKHFGLCEMRMEEKLLKFKVQLLKEGPAAPFLSLHFSFY